MDDADAALADVWQAAEDVVRASTERAKARAREDNPDLDPAAVDAVVDYQLFLSQRLMWHVVAYGHPWNRTNRDPGGAPVFPCADCGRDLFEEDSPDGTR